jgi:pyruvate formate lyase activating enzyme
LRLAPVRALLQEARRHGLNTCVQTSGAVPEAHLAAVLGLVDLFQFDLKHMDPERHRSLTGAGNEEIHANAGFLLAQGAAVQFRMPVVPGVNDGGANLDALADFLLGHGVRAVTLVPYHRLYLEKVAALGRRAGLDGLEAPTRADLERVRERLEGRGVAVGVDG